MKHVQIFNPTEPAAGSRGDAVRRLRDDEAALSQLYEDFQVLIEAIQANPMPYCVYDAEDRLLVANKAYENLYPELAEIRSNAEGRAIYYRDVVRGQLRHQFSGDALEVEIQKRVDAQRRSSGQAVERQYDVGIFNVVKYRLATGGTAGMAFDITNLKERESQLAAASDTSRQALEHEQARKSHSRHLSELGEWLQSSKSLAEVFRVVRRFMARLFPGSAGELYIYSNSRDVLDGACEWNSPGIHAHIKPDDCWALRRGRMLRYGAGLADLTCSHVHTDGEEDPDDLSYICIPIIAHGDTVGLLHMRFDEDPEGLLDLDEQVAFALQCSEQISLAVANVRLRDELEEQSTRDPLTGLFNRRHFLNRFRTDLAAARKSGAPMSLVSIDADHFKRVNDIHGHDAGDAVLRSLAEVLLSGAKDSDTVARVGGEEFSLLLPGHDAAAAFDRAEALRLRVAETELRYEGAPLPPITVSCGIATSDKIATIQSLLKVSDEALYQAKDAGRNRVFPPRPKARRKQSKA